MNLNAYAAHRRANGLRGTSHVAVLKAITTGRLTPPAAQRVGERWVIDPVLADEQWSTMTAAEKQNGYVADARPPARRERAAPMPSMPPPPPPNVKGPNRAQADAVRVTFQAKILELDYKERQGELLPKSKVDSDWFEEARRERDELQRLPEQIIGDISRVVGGLTPEQRSELLIMMDKTINEILLRLGSENA
jgi:hypothetical protein